MKSNHGQLPADVPHRHPSREEDAGQPGTNVAQLRRRKSGEETQHVFSMSLWYLSKTDNDDDDEDVLVDAVVNQQLCDERGEKRCGDAQTESTPGAIKRPPQAQRQSGQSETQLNVIHKVQLLGNNAELRTSERECVRALKHSIKISK